MEHEELKQYMYDKTRELQKEAARINETMKRAEHEQTARAILAKIPKQKSTHYTLALFSDLQFDTPKVMKNLKMLDRENQLAIIETGTPFDRAVLVMVDYEMELVTGQRLLQAGDTKLLKKSFSKDRDGYGEFLYYFNEYTKIGKAGKRLQMEFKRLQIEIADTASYINLWYEYDRIAESCTKIYRTLKESGESEQLLEKIVKTTLSSYNLKGADFTFDEEEEAYRVNVDGDGKLYEKIISGAEIVSVFTAKCKGMIKALNEYSGREDRPCVVWPVFVDMVVENITEEMYMADVLPGPCYLKSDLNRKIKKGIPVTEEDKHKAVMPAYNEVKANDNTYKDNLLYLNKL